jgi:hypothetical protein
MRFNDHMIMMKMPCLLNIQSVPAERRAAPEEATRFGPRAGLGVRNDPSVYFRLFCFVLQKKTIRLGSR